MKSRIVILIFFFFPQFIAGQDLVTLKNNQQLNIKIIEQTKKVTRYKMADYADGPLLMISNKRIRLIEYKNGYTDQMGYQNPRKRRPLGLSTGYVRWVSEAGGMVSTTADYFINPQIDLELNFGTDGASGYYYSGGSRIHFNDKYSERMLTPFAGILLGAEFNVGFIQFPAGINYLSPRGINASLSVNEMFFFNSWEATLLELRVGWRFKI